MIRAAGLFFLLASVEAFTHSLPRHRLSNHHLLRKAPVAKVLPGDGVLSMLPSSLLASGDLSDVEVVGYFGFLGFLIAVRSDVLTTGLAT